MLRRFTSLLLFSLLLCAGFLAAAPAQEASAATYTVTNSNSDGAGSLRQAILDANSHPGRDYIHFAIPTSDPGYSSALGVWFIRLTLTLPMLEDSDGVVIDGATQPGSNPNLPGIIIQHTGVPVGVPIITMWSSNNIVEYLGLFSSAGDGVKIEGGNNMLLSNQIFISDGYGVRLLAGAEDNLIRSNKICGHALGGIHLQSANNNVIFDNEVGVQPAFRPGVGRNLGNGISLVQSDKNTIERNVISDNTQNGLFLSASKGNNIVKNTIGLDPSRTEVLGNDRFGVLLEQSSDNLLYNNWVSGNVKDGIRLTGEDTSGNLFQRNMVGSSYSGPAPNGQHGIGLYNGAHNNEIGSRSNPDHVNEVQSNGWSGIVVVNSPLGSNYIGLNHIFSNGYYGIHINNSPSNTIHSNTIEGNGQAQTSAGVRIEKSSGDGTADFNYIWLNQIRNNTGKGIQLVGGANEGIAAPVISSASCTDVSGTACPNCWVQIFSDEDDEGWILEGFMRASSSGVFSYLKNFTGPHMTAVAVNSSGSSSEFSLPAYGCVRNWLPILMK